jgi:hypothetical protein
MNGANALGCILLCGQYAVFRPFSPTDVIAELLSYEWNEETHYIPSQFSLITIIIIIITKI